MGRLENEIAIITGGSLGIGRATAQVFAKEGATVIVTDVLEDQGESLCEQIRRENGKARFFRMDVAKEVDVRSVFLEVEQAVGSATVLVNNAGIVGPNKPTHEITEEEWDRVQAVNVKGVFFCTKHIVPQMMKNGGGSIINLSSIYGLIGGADVPPYHASKGAVRLMTKTDALLYAAHGIRVNSIHPAYIWTPMVEKHLESQGLNNEEGKKMIAEKHPIGHIGEPNDIAYGALYLASKEAKFVTGSELVIDGGYTCR
jgi:NAD(P)-dependent dehydrogenase (short-subunit alcohol dehydrogenase family)